MKYHKILFFICLVISIVMAVYGFYRIDSFPSIISVLISGAAWLILHNKVPYFCLIVSIIIAVTGLILGVPKIFNFLYSGFSIASWDLALMDLNLSSNAHDQKSSLYQIIRLKLLALVLAAGFLTRIIILFLNLNIPFVLMILFICLAFFSSIG
jgi:hypothetical protein